MIPFENSKGIFYIVSRISVAVCLLQLCKTFIANDPAFEKRRIIEAAAENTSRLVFFQNDRILVYENFDRVAAGKSQILSDLNGENDSAKFINSSDNTC